MPPKSKSTAGEWSQCVKCNRIVNYRDLSKHKEECFGDEEITHGHIKNDVLFGIATLCRDVGKLSVPKTLTEQLVLVHPSLMQQCGLSIGGLCIVNHTNILTCWPSSEYGPTAVGLSQSFMTLQQIKPNTLVTVQAFTESGLVAKEMSIMPCDQSHAIQESVLNFVKRSLENQYVCEGSKIGICYFGQKMNFIISEIIGQPAQIVDYKLTASSDDSSVCQSLSNLNISDISSASASSSKDVNDTKNLNVSFDDRLGAQGDDHETSNQTEIFSTPIRDTKTRSVTSGTPKTPISDLSSSTIDCFCTPNVERTHQTENLSKFYKITSDSKLTLTNNADGGTTVEQKAKETGILYTDVGGLEKQISSLKEIIHTPLEQPKLLKSYGLSPPHGVLLYGPSGCGKSMLIQAVISEININVISVSGSDIWSKFYGETETKLRKIFEDAKQSSPSLIVIDKVEILCPRRDVSHSEMEKRVVASILTLMDGINNTGNDEFVMVLATSNKPDLIDPALRRPGRFDREIEIGVPSASDRKQILTCMLSKLTHNLNESEIQGIADSTHGYVGADLLALCKEASLFSMKQSTSSTDALSLCYNDFIYGMEVVQPSAMREVQIDVPKVLWSDIGGQEHIKLKLKQAVEWPLKHPEAFTRMGISHPKGILMYGPPGCSKTMIAKALATESGLNFLAVKGPELFSKWVGESERAVREVFRKARSASPSIIFFDEIDALAVERGSSSGSSNVADRVLAQLLTEIDGVEGLSNVTIVAATNRPDMIDKALLRPGRFDRVLYVPLPDCKTRTEIFRIHLAKVPIESDVTAEWLAGLTHNYSGAEISAVCHEAAMYALQENINSEIVTKSHFELAIKSVAPRTNESLIKFYQNYADKSGLHSV